ncbi:MAG TPA: ABC transporter substrate-binding protein [Synergistaceae bacterium]|nr:ABC transporter substrate-binding protein [Synergistaceae bacterium]HPJ25383.1 ABC transporter substrate-binding protein [Synergistaceae bacterium]HPQ37166.1 ABC transporter substrate-binding protein [Synergistaceae bacterium]
MIYRFLRRFPISGGSKIFLAFLGCLFFLEGAFAFTPLFVLPQWSPQSQFAGIYVAYEKGFYLRHLLDVTILRGGPDADPWEYLRKGKADLVTQFLTSALEARDKGLPVVLLGQVVQKSSLMVVGRKDRGIESPEDLSGRPLSLWESSFRLGFDLLFEKRNLVPRIYPQYYSVNLFIRGVVDACVAMYYNEYHMLYQAGFNFDELSGFLLENYGFGFPEDGVYSTESFYRENPEACQAFVEATLEGWIYAREHPEEALDIVMKYVNRAHVPTNRGHMRWMLEKILPCILPASGDAWIPGVLSREEYRKTGEALMEGKLMGTFPLYEDFVPFKEYQNVP